MAPLTDRTRLMQNRARARAMGAERFLHDHVARDLQERLNEVNRSFTEAAVVTGFPEFWADFRTKLTVVGDDPVLDLRPGGHDLVIHAMAMHWADDPVGQLIQCARALRPDGLLLAAFPGGRTLHELRASLAEVEIALRGGLSPRVLPMGDLRDMGALLQRSGLAQPVADVSTLTLTYADVPALLRDLRAMGEGSALAMREARSLPRSALPMLDATYRRGFPTDGGRIAATVEIVTLTGWASAPSQQQPLRPGSARTRLADALGAVEHPARDAAPVPGEAPAAPPAALTRRQ